jgi:hypothetical protein
MGFPVNNMNGMERRSGIDRREKTTPLFCKYWLKGKRSLPRRQEDRQFPQMVDRYNTKLLAVILFILSLSILDAFFTLVLLDKGAKEMNPFMAYYLDISPTVFFWIKYLLTCASVLLVLFIKDFYIFKTKLKARILFFLLPIPFVLVIPWQLGLIYLVLE